MFFKVVIIGSGGFLGAIMRYLISGWIQEGTGSIGFPYGTLAVNLIGCLFIWMERCYRTEGKRGARTSPTQRGTTIERSWESVT